MSNFSTKIEVYWNWDFIYFFSKKTFHVTYRNPVRIFSSNFLSLGLSFFKWMFLLVLELHFVSASNKRLSHEINLLKMWIQSLTSLDTFSFPLFLQISEINALQCKSSFLLLCCFPFSPLSQQSRSELSKVSALLMGGWTIRRTYTNAQKLIF